MFGHKNYFNEIVWKRTSSKSDFRQGAMNWPRVHDVIFYYVRDAPGFTGFRQPFAQYSEAYVAGKYRHRDPDGRAYMLDKLTAPGFGSRGHPRYEFMGVDRHWTYGKEKMESLLAEGRIVQTGPGRVPRYKRYLDEVKGVAIGDIWTDIDPINSMAKERLGYQTQKPIALLRRIIETSTKEQDVVFDPFCGCGTAIYAAHLTNRRWIGCDVAILAVRLVRDVLKKRYGLETGRDYEIAGVPTSVEGARELFDRDPHQFQHWAVELAGGFCNNRRSGDKGIDGRIHFQTPDGLRNMVISVKGGKLTPAYVRELCGAVGAPGGGTLGGFICLEHPTKGMAEAARDAGRWEYNGRQYERVQIRTVADLLAKRGFETPAPVQPLDWERQGRLPF